LDDNKTYYVEELDITASGKALHNCGIVVPKLNDFESVTLHIKEK
ncbi:MAG: GH36 C-terminal domain-containing protein, partial [Clostridia bacterium]|nr:GH36 C-terminal domain-containing protein [Clostridia bacterium]